MKQLVNGCPVFLVVCQLSQELSPFGLYSCNHNAMGLFFCAISCGVGYLEYGLFSFPVPFLGTVVVEFDCYEVVSNEVIFFFFSVVDMIFFSICSAKI